MIKLVIKEINNYKYILEDKNNKNYICKFNFQDLKKYPQVQDIIYLNPSLLKDTRQLLTFGSLDNPCGVQVDDESEDILILLLGTEKIYLKRLYG